MTPTKRLVSVVACAYNEDGCIEELVFRLRKLAKQQHGVRWQFVVVDNGSTDKTWRILTEATQGAPEFRLVRLSRNFRLAGGLLAGLSQADGDAAIIMAADLQDPPEVIPEFIRMWESGYENVYGIVDKRNGTSIVRRVNSQLFYRVLSKATGGSIPVNVSDFRLLDRRVYDHLLALPEQKKFLRGTVAWLGFRSAGIPFERPPRYSGTSKASTTRVLSLARLALLSFSTLPLRIVSAFGLLLGALSALLLSILIFRWAIYGVPFDGFGTIVGLILLLFSLQFLFLGVLGEYVAVTLDQVRNRPQFVIAETVR